MYVEDGDALYPTWPRQKGFIVEEENETTQISQSCQQNGMLKRKTSTIIVYIYIHYLLPCNNL